jgi:hypothetical protein
MTLIKECRGCLRNLPLSSFYKHKKMADGRLNYCMECVKARVSNHRLLNIEKINEYDRARSSQPKRIKQLEKLVKRNNSDPVRRRAHQATSNAIRDGRLIRPDFCSICGKQCKPEAHHDDYTRPLNVRWLCRSCHCRHHRLESIRLANAVGLAA